MTIWVMSLSVTGPGSDRSFYSYKTDKVGPISPITNGHICFGYIGTDIVETKSPNINGHMGITISVPTYPKLKYPFINGDIRSTIMVL
jgi:hypothetical protein